MTKSDIRHLCFKLAAQQQCPDSGVESVIFDAEQCYQWIITGMEPTQDRVIGHYMVCYIHCVDLFRC